MLYVLFKKNTVFIEKFNFENQELNEKILQISKLIGISTRTYLVMNTP